MQVHCDRCGAYEQTVMAARDAGEEPDPEVQPCPDYVMSAAFQAWLVEAMRKDVLSQVSLSGLDRMAILRSREEEPGENEK